MSAERDTEGDDADKQSVKLWHVALLGVALTLFALSPVIADRYFKPREASAVAPLVAVYRDSRGNFHDPAEWNRRRQADAEFWKSLRDTPAPPMPVAQRPAYGATNFADGSFNDYGDDDYEVVPPDEARKGTGRPKTVKVRAYYRKDGTYVKAHTRSRPQRRQR